jgi:hypothetical protein
MVLMGRCASSGAAMGFFKTWLPAFKIKSEAYSNRIP